MTAARDRAWETPDRSYDRAFEMWGPHRFWFVEDRWSSLRALRNSYEHDHVVLHAHASVARASRVACRIDELLDDLIDLVSVPASTEAGAERLRVTALEMKALSRDAISEVVALSASHDIPPPPLNQRSNGARKTLALDLATTVLRSDPTFPTAPAPWAYFAIAVGLNEPPAERRRSGRRRPAHEIFRMDNVKEWQSVLRAARRSLTCLEPGESGQ